MDNNKVKTKIKKKKIELTPVKLTVVSLGAFILMLSVGISPKLMGNSVSKNSYKVIYNSNGGTGSMSNQVVKSGESVQLNKNMFNKKGYYFNGWKAKKSNNTWMCYIDSNNFGWTNQSNCNKYGYVIYSDGAYINDLANQSDTVYMYADWKK